ncbi:Poly [ADP-ribose] polymerase 1 [Araneus ventricosus]|uniref:Poly [ADP-ribose] polymerase n=1 Tax=Araneus ventricosus TaxID=182803 RepID=A0A4Y2C9G1_ARAVE|nr:Poly [ADP-ribose] polymerase 1 [Araneus ventricosus]
MRDKIWQSLPKNYMIRLLDHNRQYVPTSENKLLDHLADCLVFGALKACPDCKSEALCFMNNKYICSGHLNEWTKCQFETKFPERKKFEIPDCFHHIFTDYKCVVRERMFASTDEALPIKKNLPLNKLKIVLLGNFQTAEDNVRKQLQELGAKVQKTITDKVDLCVISPGEIDSNMSKISKAQTLNIHVVSEDFIKDIRGGSSVVQAVQNNLLSSWGDDPLLKFDLNPEREKQKLEADKEQCFSKDLPEKVTVTVKGAAAVDVESGLQLTCQVYQKEGEVYSAVLAYVDASNGKNSFYKLQVLRADSGSSYYLFRQWGRVGTKIGGKKVESFDNVQKAVRAFEKLYFEQTENHWRNRKNFQKKPGRKYPLEVDYGQDSEEVQQKLKAGENSRLSKPVQELICLIFDQDAMMMTMIEFEIDLKKMPLGKISEKQIAMAYEVLGEAQQILARDRNKSKITEVSNRFFTLIPHNFGLKKPPLLDNEEIIKSKIEMLDSLLQIGIAYSIIKDQAEKEDPIDMHYRKLKADIEAVEKDTEEYFLIETYLKNTHAPTHDQYVLELLEVFRVNRHGESENYRKFRGLHNKKLLWHGSRLTNFVGILSQGLRIAPPEAPVSGYMFGKGVYFADMASKSANYCVARNSTGLLLLCEVALGNMYEKTSGEYIEKLPDGKHSTLGMGITIPDPTEKVFIGDVEVPYGRPVQKTDISNSRLLYNEYIVYDTNQINIKYLLKVNFSSVRY